MRAMIEMTQRLLSAAEGGEPVLLAAVFETGDRDLVPGARLIVEKDGARVGTLGDPALDELVAAYAPDAFVRHAAETVYIGESGISTRTIHGAPSLYIEIVESRPTFVVVGAGHIGVCMAKLAKFLDFYVIVIDDREDFATEERLPDADEVMSGDYEEMIDALSIGANTYIVMVTRGHKQDEIALRRSLGRGAGYLGMIGSKRRTGAVIEHLTSEGFDPEELARIHTPIGLDIGAETPEEISVSIMAEVIQMRRGGNGLPMYYRRGQSQA